MTLPFAIPPWVPWWVPILVLIPAVLYGLVLFMMPFSVIGVKGRLEALDERLDDIQAELHQLAERLPDTVAGRSFEDTSYTQPPSFNPVIHPEPQAGVTPHPPIPPIPATPSGRESVGRRRENERPSNRATRAEPRLDWPRT